MHRTRVDEKRREIAALERFVAELQGEVARLDANLIGEQEIAKTSESGGYAYGNFALASIDRRRKLMASVAEVEGRIQVAKDGLHEAFKELKRHEIVRASRAQRTKMQAERRTQSRLDDISLEIHRRRMG
ncbi:MAG: hypothetical protein HY057_02490 [Rhodospirillales bacterium]|nr:hypothetical protein [Rhodospirillales bacterium]